MRKERLPKGRTPNRLRSRSESCLQAVFALIPTPFVTGILPQRRQDAQDDHLAQGDLVTLTETTCSAPKSARNSAKTAKNSPLPCARPPWPAAPRRILLLAHHAAPCPRKEPSRGVCHTAGMPLSPRNTTGRAACPTSVPGGNPLTCPPISPCQHTSCMSAA